MTRFGMARRVAARSVIGIVIAAAVPGAGLADAAAAAAPGATWHKPVQVRLPANAAADPNAGLSGLACSSASSCLAGGSYATKSHDQLAMIATESGGKWARGFSLALPSNASSDPGGEVTALACPTSTYCVAVGSYAHGFFHPAFIATQAGGKWARAIQPRLPKNASAGVQANLIGVRCAAPGSCVAVGSYADSKGRTQAMIITQAGGKWGRAAEVSLPRNAGASPNAELDDVGCPSGSCVAVGSYQTGPRNNRGMAVVESKGKWGRATETALPGGADAKKQDAFLAHVTCSSPHSCLAVGGFTTKSGAQAALAVTMSKGGWKRAVEVAGPRHARAAGLYAVSCSATFCLAVGSYRDTSGATRGLAVAESRGKWGRATQVSPPAGARTGAAHYTLPLAVACTNSGTCTVVGAYNDGSSFSRAFAVVRS
jgi:hypothetical protein